jgi:hypothetical protein
MSNHRYSIRATDQMKNALQMYGNAVHVFEGDMTSTKKLEKYKWNNHDAHFLDFIVEKYDCSEQDAIWIYLMVRFLPRMYNQYGGYGGLERNTNVGKATWWSWMKKFDIPIERVARANPPEVLDDILKWREDRVASGLPA